MGYMCKSIDGLGGTAGKLVDWVKWVSTAALLPLLGLGLFWFARIEDRIDTTDKAHLTAQVEMWKAIAEKADRSNVPPKEVRDTLKRIDRTLAELRQLITDHIVNGDH